jgi:hypothetical protein
LAKAKFGLDLFPEPKVRPTHDVPMAKHTNKRDPVCWEPKQAARNVRQSRKESELTRAGHGRGTE